MSAIVPGDLVICVHVHCASARCHLGKILQVVAVLPGDSGTCLRCGQRDIGPFSSFVTTGTGLVAYPIPWVRKIEPLAELDRWHDVLEVSQ